MVNCNSPLFSSPRVGRMPATTWRDRTMTAHPRICRKGYQHRSRRRAKIRNDPKNLQVSWKTCVEFVTEREKYISVDITESSFYVYYIVVKRIKYISHRRTFISHPIKT